MTNSETGITSVNEAILLDPAGSANNEMVRKLELDEPGLKVLCPLAKAIYLAETGRLDHAACSEALETLWCIDDSFASDNSWTGEYAQINERVHHSINLKIGEKAIELGFRSSTEMTYCECFWPDYVRSVSAAEWCADAGLPSSEFVEAIFSRLDQGAAASQPQGYPTDSGDFIGTSTYKLVSIGGLEVDGPRFNDDYHEQSWRGLSSEYGQEVDEEVGDGPKGFYWLHYLSKSQADELGLTASGDEAIGPDKGHPEWAPRTLMGDASKAWISADMIRDSYSEGRLQVEPSTQAYIAIGSGKRWDPSSNPDGHEEIEEDAHFTEYPEHVAPLLEIEIARGSLKCPDDLSRLLPYLNRLFAGLQVPE